MKAYECDVLIVGSGVAGLYCALNLPSNLKITIISKSALEECDSYLAQGGICVLKEESDFQSYFEDTMKAGHYENNPQSVGTMIRHSPSVIEDLIRFGTRFERDESGNLKYTREGAHSTPRILFHEDITGKEITSSLLRAVKKLRNVEIYENTTMLDIIEKKDSNGVKYCAGIIASCKNSSPLAEFSFGQTSQGEKLCALLSRETVWATGGIGGLFLHSTNYPHLTGDALGIALAHQIALENPDYIQIHPTTFYDEKSIAQEKKERSFLISESVRGEGGILLDKNGNRFVNELLPRDVVANAIFAQMKKDGTNCVWLSMKNIDEDEIKTHFKHIYEHCLSHGYDCTKRSIPVVPAQHYFMGGVFVNSDSRTTMNHLYAVGETSCNGVHGKNRLASNSLLESLVFARIAAKKISSEIKDIKFIPPIEINFCEDDYKNTASIFEKYKTSILNEIKRMKEYHERNHNETEHGQLDSASA